MAAKILVAQNRMFKGVFVCRDCNQKMRSDAIRVIDKKVSCRRCGGYNFRPIKKK